MKRIPILLVFLLVSNFSYAQPEYLDKTFADDGYSVLNPNGKRIHPYTLQLMPDGRILHGGWKELDASKARFYLMMHKKDGKPDTSFGVDGFRPVSAISGFSAISLAAYPDGRVLVYGSMSEGTSYKSKPFIARFLSDGSPDSSFGKNGIYQEHNCPSDSYFAKVKIHDDGNFTAIGAEQKVGSAPTIFYPMIAKITSDGKQDSSLSTNGYLRIGSESDTGYIYDAVFTKSGGVVIPLSLSESTFGALSMVKCDMKGVIDSSFGTNGRVSMQISDNMDMIRALVETPDQSIVCASIINLQNNYQSILVRFKKDGAFDASFGDFGTAGSLDLVHGNYFDQCILDSNGNIIVTGSLYINTLGYTPAIIRYDRNGKRDSLFGNNGVVIGPLDSLDFIPGIAVQQDGKYVAAGVLAGTEIGITKYYGMIYRVNNGASTTVSQKMSVSSTISLYPTPSTDNCTVTYTLPSSSNCTMTLRDESGREIKTFTTNQYRTTGEHKEELDLRGLAVGVYFLQIESNGSIQTVKLIKQ
jgi:uncharacterized delta-60 repeat protein